LARIPTLERLTIPANARNLEELKTLPALKMLAYSGNATNGLPVHTAEDFWKLCAANGWISRLRDSGVKINKLEQRSDGTWKVDLRHSDISDLSILSGASIYSLWIAQTRVTDLSPLRDMPLEALSIFRTPVTDLSPLRGMPLRILYMSGLDTLTDISPLADCKTLEEISLPNVAKDIEIFRTLPNLKRIGFGLDPTTWRPRTTAAQFWKDYDQGKRPSRSDP
jgi:hypothetical protein